MKRFALILIAVATSGCAAVQPPAECSGPVRKVNPETVLSSIQCKSEVA